MKKIVVRLGERSYPILIGAGLISRAGEELRELGLKGCAFIITNDKVMKIFGPALRRSLKKCGIEASVELVPDSEKSKSSGIYIGLVKKIAKRDVLKRPFIIALGGGVVGDLSGFVAATYKRGVPFVQIPTTLLAQVDSAIGGKTAIDLACAKNMVGAFYQPRAVLSDVSALSSLPKGMLVSGLAEVIKYGVIRDRPLFRFLEGNLARVLAGDEGALEYIVYRSSVIKASVVEQDEHDDKGVRAILNYGHTIGHAIEAAASYSRKYSHGEAVAIGMAAAAYISRKRGILPADDLTRICALIKEAGLPVRAQGVAVSGIYKALLHDKKFIRGLPRFVLPAGIGRVRVVEGIKASEIKAALARAATGVYG